MIYFTSDLHLGHEAAMRFTQRPFETVEEMNRTIIANFNARVSARDTVYLLGDLAHRLPVEEAEKLIGQLNGKKILIKGNHDKKYAERFFEEICDFKEIRYDGYKISLMHYPMLEWPSSRHGSIQLHGHIHSEEGKEYEFAGFSGNNYNQDCKNRGIHRYDVGVDANHYMPVSIQEVLRFLTDEEA